MFKPRWTKRRPEPAAFDNFPRSFRTAKDRTCNEVKQSIASRESNLEERLPFLLNAHIQDSGADSKEERKMDGFFSHIGRPLGYGKRRDPLIPFLPAMQRKRMDVGPPQADFKPRPSSNESLI